MLISFIICTFNRCNLLKSCLLSFINQKTEFSNYEIIVINNNCADNTDSVVQTFCNLYSNIRSVKEINQGLSYARNRGCDEAKGVYLCYIDDDAKLSDTFIDTVVKEIVAFNPDIYGGPVYPYYTRNKPSWFKDHYEIRLFSKISGFSIDCRVSGGNFIIKRNILIGLGKFDVDLGMKGNKIGIGEERAILDLYRKRTPKESQKVYYSLESYVWHYVPAEKMNRWYMMKRYYQIGRTSMRIKNKEPASAIERTILFVPNQLNFAYGEITNYGFLSADYTKIFLNSCLRIGNIIELYSHGFIPVFGPHISKRYKKLRRYLKKTPLRGFMFWYERKLGLSYGVIPAKMLQVYNSHENYKKILKKRYKIMRRYIKSTLFRRFLFWFEKKLNIQI